MQKKPSVLIVGAGAMGMVTGYHLHLAGADVSFLVRPTRLATLQSPQILYCHNDGELKRFSQYRAISSIGEIDAQALDFVIFTLDGATSRTTEGSELLRGIGTAIRKGTARLMIGGVGVGLREHVLRLSGLPDSRVMNCFLGLLSYPPAKADIPITPPTRAEVIGKADLAYVQMPNQLGFVVDAAHGQASKDFVALYNRCGVSQCKTMNPQLFQIVTNMPFPSMAISEIAGWPHIAELGKDKALWRLNCQAQNEILSLKQHGWPGKLMRWLISDGMHLKILQKVERDMLPLDYQAFNRFHHGGKVQAQDIEIMQNCVAEGERQGLAMSALKQVLARLDAFKKTQA